MNAQDYYSDLKGRTQGWGPVETARTPVGRGLQLANEVRRLPKGTRLLDIGCQSGALLRSVAPRFDELYGVDIGDYSEYWNEAPPLRCSIHNVDAGPLPFADGFFDVVVCAMVLEHVFDVFGLVGEIGRLLKPSGHALIEVPNIGYIKHFVSLLRGRVPRTGAVKVPFEKTQGWDGQHLHYFTITEMKWLLAEYGMRFRRVVSGGRFPALRRIWPSALYSAIIMTVQKGELAGVGR